MADHVLQPSEVGVARRRDAVFPADIFLQLICAPVAHVERRIGHHEVGFQRGVTVVEESVSVAVAQIGLDASDGEVHHGHLAGVGVDFLSEDAEVLDVALDIASQNLSFSTPK